ncbi:TlpA disulfide reductase family protein [Pseudophaeobacter sp.]|uniref:TlpA family protein disulfide reductase n=1 Tax=Pseudophaeobacter sp. TaxID=1971739 RepID=UPI003299252A
MSDAAVAAQAIISSCALSYQSLPAFSGRILTFPVTQSSENSPPAVTVIDYIAGTGTDASFQMEGYGGTAIGERVYLIQENRPGVYVVFDLDLDLFTTMQNVLGAAMFVPPQITLRGSKAPSAWLRSLGLGLLTGLVATAVHSETDTSGESADIIELQGNQGTLKAKFNAKSAHLQRIDLFIADIEFAYIVEQETEIPADKTVQFNPSGREEATSFSSILGGPAKIGEPAPEITLTALNGRSWSSAHARGRRLVLDFWALWCRPCLAEMPHLDALANRLKDAGASVEIWTIALVEDDDEESDLNQIRDMWTTKGFDLPVLIDRNGRVSQDAYGIRSVPTTVILTADGVVEVIQAGLSSAALEALLER